MSAHARLSCSGAHRWMACPGSVQLEADLPEQSSRYADEGSAAHMLAEWCLDHEADAADAPDEVARACGVAWPPDMRQAVQVYLDYVRGLTAPGTARYTEQALDLSAWIPGGFGTSDVIVVGDGVLRAIDYKHGAGVRVDAANNPQTRLYGLGALHAFDAIEDIHTVETHIVQPRMDHISVEVLSVEDLRAWGETVKVAAAAVEQPDAPLVPGEKQCRFCRAKAVCPGRARANLAVAQREFATPGAPPVASPAALSIPELATLLPHLDELVAWAKDVQEYCAQQALAGRAVPGYKLVEGRSARTWADEAAVIAALRKLKYPKADYIVEKLIGITDAEKLLGGKKAAAPILDPLTIKPPGKPTLVPEADRRPALNTAESARTDFADAA